MEHFGLDDIRVCMLGSAWTTRHNRPWRSDGALRLSFHYCFLGIDLMFQTFFWGPAHWLMVTFKNFYKTEFKSKRKTHNLKRFSIFVSIFSSPPLRLSSNLVTKLSSSREWRNKFHIFRSISSLWSPSLQHGNRLGSFTARRCLTSVSCVTSANTILR